LVPHVLGAEAAERLAVPDLIEGLFEERAERRFIQAAGADFAGRRDPDRRPRLAAGVVVVQGPGPFDVIELALTGEAASEVNVPAGGLRCGAIEDRCGISLQSEVLVRIEGVEVGALALEIERL